MVGPNYKRPSVDVPEHLSWPDGRGSGQAAPASLGDQKWWEVFQDQQLQQLIRTALQQNYDVRIAAARVLEAQAQLGITRANQYPTVNGVAPARICAIPQPARFRRMNSLPAA